MQADFGNYDAERHTMECLQQCTLFPKVFNKVPEMTKLNICWISYEFYFVWQDVMQADLGGQDSLLHTAILQYKNLVGVTQAAAEELYISIVMQLEGYGNETFSTKVLTPLHPFMLSKPCTSKRKLMVMKL